MYCSNSRKPTPLHILLADIHVVEVWGGSRNLMKILNQLGVVSSTVTHNHFVTAVAEKQREREREVYVTSFLTMYLQLQLQTIWTCCRVMQLCTVVTSIAVTMARQYN